MNEGLTQESVTAIVGELRRRVGDPSGITGFERKHLEPAAVTALSPVYGARVAKDRKVEVPQWANAGRADLVVWTEPKARRLTWLAELKWCGPGNDILYEGVSDLFTMALATQRPERPRAYLLSGAEASVWRRSRFRDLFDDEEHDCARLCRRELPTRRPTLAWDDLLRGGYGRYPEVIPARVSTRVCGRAPVGDWEVRAVEVSVVGDEWVLMSGGWPHGRRPAIARYPTPPPGVGGD